MNAPAASWRQHVSDAFVIFQKELLDLRRDRRALVTLIVVPVVYSLLVEPAVSVASDPGPSAPGSAPRQPGEARPSFSLGDRPGAAPGMARGRVEP